MALIGIFTIIVGVVFYRAHSSKYSLTDTSNGFTINAERLNETISRQYDLKKGDVIEVIHAYDGGEI